MRGGLRSGEEARVLSGAFEWGGPPVPVQKPDCGKRGEGMNLHFYGTVIADNKLRRWLK
jgi:hypothetical protein